MPSVAIESAEGKSRRKSHPYEWEMDSHLHTLRRAHEIVSDKKLMGHLKKHAAKRAHEAQNMAQHAERLAKMGRISPKAMESVRSK